jgi:uncharacterized protein with HEPN domain
MKKDDSVFLRHILNATERIQRYTGGMEERAFLGNELVQDGVLRQLEIIGEAVKHLSGAMRDNHPDVPWKSIAGTRDKLIHRYFGVNFEEIWLAVQRDIPLLKTRVNELLNELTEQ